MKVKFLAPYRIFQRMKNISFDFNCIDNGCKMKLFQQTLKFHQMMGISMPKANQNYKQKFKTIIFVFSFIQIFISSSAFFLLQAKSLREHIETLTLPITEIVCVIYILVFKWKMTEILKLIENFVGFIEKSKLTEMHLMQCALIKQFYLINVIVKLGSTTVNSKNVYIGINDKIERISKLIYFTIVHLTLSGTYLPYVLQTLFNYFVLNLNEESFCLPFPVMYVVQITYSQIK